MKHKVPKFLERETKIVAFLNFKQLAVVGMASLALFILYYLVPKALFFFLFFAIEGLVFSLLFVRVEGIPLGQLITRFFSYYIKPKSYIWRKKEVAQTIGRLKIEKKPKEKEETTLRLTPKTRLERLSARLEMGIR